MFTGIVEELGSLVSRTDGAQSCVLEVHAPTISSDLRPGDSVAVDGICLTVVEPRPDGFTADVMAETLACTTLGDRVAGDPVNLERALRADARLGGHVVQGHIDGTTTVLGRTPGDRWEVVRVALDGVSLTVSAVDDAAFEVSLIPTTLALTTLGHRAPGDRVNVEVDVLAKYVERLVQQGVAG